MLGWRGASLAPASPISSFSRSQYLVGSEARLSTEQHPVSVQLSNCPVPFVREGEANPNLGYQNPHPGGTVSLFSCLVLRSSVHLFSIFSTLHLSYLFFVSCPLLYSGLLDPGQNPHGNLHPVSMSFMPAVSLDRTPRRPPPHPTGNHL